MAVGSELVAIDCLHARVTVVDGVESHVDLPVLDAIRHDLFGQLERLNLVRALAVLFQIMADNTVGQPKFDKHNSRLTNIIRS
jgi:hypothetical protein